MEFKLNILEAIVRRCSLKKVFLKIRKIQRKAPTPKSLFDEVAF